MLPLDRQNALREAYRHERQGWRPATERFAAAVRRYMTPASYLLDYGCGRGGLIEQLTEPFGFVVGFDLDETSLREHRIERMPRAVIGEGGLPLRDGCMDIVIASWVLEHMEEPAHDLREIARVLRPGASFLFITPHVSHPLIKVNQLIGRISALQGWLVEHLFQRLRADTFPAYYRANHRRELVKLGRAAGLSLASLEYVTDPTYWGMVPRFYPLFRRLDESLPPVHLVGHFVRTASASNEAAATG